MTTPKNNALVTAVHKAEVTRIKSNRKNASLQKVGQDDALETQKLSQKWEHFQKKLDEFKRLKGYETPIVIFNDMMEQWIDLLDLLKDTAPNLLGGLIRAIPIVGEPIVNFLKIPPTLLKGKIKEWGEHGFKDPEVIMPVLVHLVEMDDKNVYKPYALKGVSSKATVTPEMKERFDEGVFEWLNGLGYFESKTNNGQFFKTNPDGSKVQLKQAKFKELRDSPTKGLNAYFKEHYDLILKNEDAPTPSVRHS